MDTVKIKVKYGKDEKEIEIKENARIRDILSLLNINIEEVVVKKNKELCTEEDRIKAGDYLEIIRVVSGG